MILPAVPAAASSSVSSSASSPVSSSVLPLRARLCYVKRPSIDFLGIELVDGLLGCGIIRHLDECKALGPTRPTICDESHRDDLADRSEKLR